MPRRRKAAGISITRLAEAAGMTDDEVLAVERGGGDAEAAARLARALEVLTARRPAPARATNRGRFAGGRLLYPCPAYGELTNEECSITRTEGREPCRGCPGVRHLAPKETVDA